MAAYLRAEQARKASESGGYPSGGGGYVSAAPAAPPPPRDPMSDPAYLAYINALNVEENNLKAQRALQSSNLGVNRDTSLGNLQKEWDNPGGVLDRLRSSFEQRGAIRSGAYSAGKTRAEDERASRRGAITTGYNQAIQELEARVAAQMLEINQRRQQALLQFAGG